MKNHRLIILFFAAVIFLPTAVFSANTSKNQPVKIETLIQKDSAGRSVVTTRQSGAAKDTVATEADFVAGEVIVKFKDVLKGERALSSIVSGTSELTNGAEKILKKNKVTTGRKIVK